jgi:hypothetical protein
MLAESNLNMFFASSGTGQQRNSVNGFGPNGAGQRIQSVMVLGPVEQVS